MNIGFATHTGRKRRHNEDSYVVEPPMFAVADGMGGAKAGEVASGLAAAALKETGTDGSSGEERVTQLIQEANRRVFRRANEDREASGMGTTMTVALVEDGRVVFGHVGDSRAYLIREGSIEQLTDDHSLVAELVRSGRLTPEEAEAHPQRSVITRAVGTEPDVDVDTFTIEPEAGDLFLICSDGLTDMAWVGRTTSPSSWSRSARRLNSPTRSAPRRSRSTRTPCPASRQCLPSSTPP